MTPEQSQEKPDLQARIARLKEILKASEPAGSEWGNSAVAKIAREALDHSWS